MRSKQWSYLGDGSLSWYIGQHSMVRQALVNSNLKAAIEAASALSDLGIQGKSYNDVIKNPTLLRAFKEALTVTHAQAGFYTRDSLNLYQKDAAAIGASLIDQALASAANPGPVITLTEEQQILQNVLPPPEPEPSFLSRNKVPIFLGGSVLALGIIGMILLVDI